jgi:hypothetical protein
MDPAEVSEIVRSVVLAQREKTKAAITAALAKRGQLEQQIRLATVRSTVRVKTGHTNLTGAIVKIDSVVYVVAAAHAVLSLDTDGRTVCATLLRHKIYHVQSNTQIKCSSYQFLADYTVERESDRVDVMLARVENADHCSGMALDITDLPRSQLIGEEVESMGVGRCRSLQQYMRGIITCVGPDRMLVDFGRSELSFPGAVVVAHGKVVGVHCRGALPADRIISFPTKSTLPIAVLALVDSMTDHIATRSVTTAIPSGVLIVLHQGGPGVATVSELSPTARIPYLPHATPSAQLEHEVGYDISASATSNLRFEGWCVDERAGEHQKVRRARRANPARQRPAGGVHVTCTCTCRVC